MFFSIKNTFTIKYVAISFYVALLVTITSSTQAFAADVITSKEASYVIEKKQNNAVENTTWLHLEPSIRPAYVGIHGGTAPVTLLRGSDGFVYAITGQTGNDFILALRNGNSSAQKIPDKSTANEISEGNQNSDISSSKKLTREDISIFERWADSTQWMATLKNYSIREDKHDIAKNEIIQPKPKNYPDVVFTSREGFERLAQKNNELQAFGFLENDMPAATNLNGTQFSNIFLELKDYRDILGSL